MAATILSKMRWRYARTVIDTNTSAELLATEITEIPAKVHHKPSRQTGGPVSRRTLIFASVKVQGTPMSECRYHSHFGSYCETPEQFAASLCEDCLDAEARRKTGDDDTGQKSEGLKLV